MYSFLHEKNKKLQLIVLTISIAIAMAIYQAFSEIQSVENVESILNNPWVKIVLSIIVAVFSYQTIISLVLFLVNHTSFFLYL